MHLRPFRSLRSLRSLLALTVALSAASHIHAQTTPPTPITLPTVPISAYPTVATKIEAALAAPAMRHAAVGILVTSLKTGAVVYEHNADLSLNPASCEKLLTGSTTLMRLGPDFVYHTTLYRTGTIGPDGTLNGDLYLRGMGDPSFSSADLLTLAKALYASGVRHLNGHIYADASRFDAAYIGLGWEWEDLPYDYCAQLAALNCDENVATVTVSPSAASGAPPTVAIDGTPLTQNVPDITGSSYITLRNTAQTGTGGSHIHVNRAEGRNEINVIGEIAPEAKAFSGVVTIHDPALFTAYRLQSILTQTGINIAPGSGVIGEEVVPTNATMVAEKVSAPLSALLTHCWKVSDNLYAEAFLKTVGAEKGTGGSSSAGAAVVEAFLRESGVDNSGVVQVDGSGLSRRDLVTARALVGLLAAMDKQPAPQHDVFLNALPIAGVDGTLRNRMKGTSAQGHVQGKTGSLSAVSALSGFATGQKSGERFAFSVLVNNYGGGAVAAHALQDSVAVALCNQ